MNDTRFNVLVGNFLRYGVLLCGGILVAGLLGHAEPVVWWGLAVLVALPVLRVALTLVLFLLEKDWLYVGITALVLLILSTSIWLGHAL